MFQISKFLGVKITIKIGQWSTFIDVVSEVWDQSARPPIRAVHDVQDVAGRGEGQHAGTQQPSRRLYRQGQ